MPLDNATCLRDASNASRSICSGGAATTAEGAHIAVEAVHDGAARQSLQEGADLWREIVDKQNRALALVVAAMCLGISIIVAAAIH